MQLGGSQHPTYPQIGLTPAWDKYLSRRIPPLLSHSLQVSVISPLVFAWSWLRIQIINKVILRDIFFCQRSGRVDLGG